MVEQARGLLYLRVFSLFLFTGYIKNNYSNSKETKLFYWVAYLLKSPCALNAVIIEEYASSSAKQKLDNYTQERCKKK